MLLYERAKKNALPKSQKSIDIAIYRLLFSNLSVPTNVGLKLPPFLPKQRGWQDVIGSNPSIFLDKNNFKERFANL
jgi:hypothetical protein